LSKVNVLPLENPERWTVFLSKSNSILRVKEVQGATDSNTHCSAATDACVISEEGIFHKVNCSPSQNIDEQEVFLSQQTEFSQGNNVLHTPSSYIDYFLPIHTNITSIPLNKPILNEMNVSPT
jgi:hypothetical protein